MALTLYVKSDTAIDHLKENIYNFSLKKGKTFLLICSKMEDIQASVALEGKSAGKQCATGSQGKGFRSTEKQIS